MSVGDKCCSNGMHGCHNNNNSSSNIPLATPAITTTTAAAIMTTHMGHTKAFGAQFDVKRARTEGELGGSSIQIAVLGLCRRHILFPPTCCYYYWPPKKADRDGCRKMGNATCNRQPESGNRNQ